jgi:acetyltransferase-like isoleucine patch superfamily enzyme
VVDAYCRVEPLARVGEDSLVLYRETVGVGAEVGKRCVIGGSVSEYTIIEDDCTSFGRLIHTHWDSMSSWDYRDEPEPSPIVRRRSFIGHDALVIGDIEIGPLAYICAGATITRSVPPHHIASVVNKITHFSQWPGRLARKPMFQRSV